MKGFEAVLIGVLGEGIEERGYNKFKEFHFRAEDGDGTVRESRWQVYRALGQG